MSETTNYVGDMDCDWCGNEIPKGARCFVDEEGRNGNAVICFECGEKGRDEEN